VVLLVVVPVVDGTVSGREASIGYKT